MQSQLFNNCTDAVSLPKCIVSSAGAFVLQLLQSHYDPVYWLLVSLYFFDFTCGLFCAVLFGDFEFEKFKIGLRKMFGYLLLIIPLMLTDHFLLGNPQVGVYHWLKNWCLLYMCALEMVSIARHLRMIGVPVPGIDRLKKFMNAVTKLKGNGPKTK